MISYDKQLDLKREVIIKAYRNFSSMDNISSCQIFNKSYLEPSLGLSPEALPTVQATIPSPLQYNYRTKITPHFEAPPKRFLREQTGPPAEKPVWLNIGFNQAGTRKVMDIEVILSILQKSSSKLHSLSVFRNARLRHQS